MFEVNGNVIKVPRGELDLAHTLECGQFFRYEKLQDEYKIESGSFGARAYEKGDSVFIETDSPAYFIRFFDLERDIERVRRELSHFEELKPMLESSKGLRILRQPLFETIITFVISANNNMPRIKNTVKKLCGMFGGEFPSPDKLKTVPIRQLESLGCGYRAAYIAYDAEFCADTDFLSRLEGVSSADAVKLLKTLKGVGPKVADCVALFALGRYDVCPVDTWIFNKLREGLENEQQVRARLCRRYGENAGYAQQVVFNYYAVLKV